MLCSCCYGTCCYGTRYRACLTECVCIMQLPARGDQAASINEPYAEVMMMPCTQGPVRPRCESLARTVAA